MRLFHKKQDDLRLQLVSCDYGLEDLEKQLPITCQLLKMIPGDDRPDYWLAKCDCPIKNEDVTVNYLVLAARFVGAKMKKGMGSIILNVAYVVDESLLQDSTLDFNKCRYVAICNAIES